MKPETLMKRLGLSGEDLDRIAEAVASAESRTTGEIALAATGESADYSFRELFAAVIFGALAFALTLSLHSGISGLLDRLSWHLPAWYATAACGVLSFGAMGVFFFLANVPFVDRLVVPKEDRTRAVYRRALRHFVESGVYGTHEHTGILIFISLMEREVRILADTGINGKIEQPVWNAMADKIAAGVKEGRLADALLEAIASCGDILEKNFPAKKDNPDELANGLVLLGGGE